MDTMVNLSNLKKVKELGLIKADLPVSFFLCYKPKSNKTVAQTRWPQIINVWPVWQTESRHNT